MIYLITPKNFHTFSRLTQVLAVGKRLSSEPESRIAKLGTSSLNPLKKSIETLDILWLRVALTTKGGGCSWWQNVKASVDVLGQMIWRPERSSVRYEEYVDIEKTLPSRTSVLLAHGHRTIHHISHAFGDHQGQWVNWRRQGESVILVGWTSW